MGDFLSAGLSLGGSLLGGDGGGGAAANAQVQGLMQALQYAQQNYGKAMNLQTQMYNTGLNQLTQGYQQALGQQAPYTYSGLNAYDRLLKSTGQAPPDGGSFQMMQAVSQYPSGQVPQMQETDLDAAAKAHAAIPGQAQNAASVASWNKQWAALNNITDPSERLQAKYQFLNNKNQQETQYFASPGDPAAAQYAQGYADWSQKYMAPLTTTFNQQQNLTPADYQLAQIANNYKYGNPNVATNQVKGPDYENPVTADSIMGQLNALPSQQGIMSDFNQQMPAISAAVQAAIQGKTNAAELIPVLQQFASQYANNPAAATWLGQANQMLSQYASQQGGASNNPGAPGANATGTLNGQVGTYSTQASQDALNDFFNTPQYQLLFGNSGAQVDPNASVLDRFQTSPGYQFQMDQGMDQLQRQAAAKGQLNSGATLKALNQYAQGVANQDFNNYQTKLNSTFQNYQNNLMQLAGMGQASANVSSGLNQAQGQDTANLGSNYANANSSLLSSLGNLGANIFTGVGQANAQGAMAAGAQQSNMANGVGQSLGSLFGGGGGSGMFGGLF